MATAKRPKKRGTSSSHTSSTHTSSQKSSTKNITQHDIAVSSPKSFSFHTLKNSSTYILLRKTIPYVLVLIGISVAVLFVLQRLSASYGQFCGEYTSEFAYVDDCTCIGIKSVVPTQVGNESYEIRCLGFKTSCHREYMVWPKTEPIECADE